MSNDELNTFLLLMLFMAVCVFMGIWAYIGYLVIRGVRKVKRTVHQFTAYGKLPTFPISPVLKPAKYEQRAVSVDQSRPILRRVSTIIYTKEY